MAFFKTLWGWFSPQPTAKPAPHKVQRLVVSEKLFALPPELIAELRLVQASSWPDDEIAREHDAFLLDPGLGPPTYLSTNGTILWDTDYWDVDPTPEAAYAAIVVGASKTGVRALLELLPKRPDGAIDCTKCEGTGWFNDHGSLKGVDGRPFSYICECGGLGWRVEG